MPVKTITAAEQKRAAQIFDLLSAISVVTVVPIALWFGASIFVYASIGHHPNPRVVSYLRPAGYRFYGFAGTLVVVLNFSSTLAHWVGGALNLALLIWVIGLLAVALPGLLSMRRAARENWQDMDVEVEHV